MQTRCPACKTTFRLSEIQTVVASGMVQCGVCQHFFNSLNNETPEVTQQPHSQSETLAEKSRDLAADNLSQSLARAYVMEKVRAPWWSTLFWTLLILIMVISALGQLAWFNREQLVLQPGVKPYVERACQRMDCQLQQKVDLTSIELLSRDVRSHPTEKNSLLVTATFINRATYEQPFPDVALLLADLEGNVIAQRQFTPNEYLKVDYQEKSLMAQEVPTTMILEVQDPGKVSVSYRFEFL